MRLPILDFETASHYYLHYFISIILNIKCKQTNHSVIQADLHNGQSNSVAIQATQSGDFHSH